MPLYDFECQECGYVEERFYTFDTAKSSTSHCGESSLVRVIRPPHVTKPYVEHFNHTVGAHISSDRAFRDHLKRGSEEASTRTGVEHNYQPVDPSDVKALGVTDEGLENTHRIHRKQGLTKAKKAIFG